MSHTDDVLAEIVAANERVTEAATAMAFAKAEASARSKAYAEAVDHLLLTIGASSRESPTPLLDQAEADQAEPGQGVTDRRCGTSRIDARPRRTRRSTTRSSHVPDAGKPGGR